MRRSAYAARVLAPTLVLGLILSGCSSSTGAKRTSTVYQTVTSGSVGGSTAAGGSITVGVPSGSDAAGSSGAGASSGAGGSAAVSGSAAASGPSGATGSGSAAPSSKPATTSKAATTSAKPTTSAAASTAPTTAKADPLAVDCGALLAPADVKKITGVTIPAAGSRIKDVANSKIGSTGSIRCLYGVTAGKQKMSLRLTKYSSVAAAAKQVAVTVESETELGAKASESTVGGQKAHVLLRDGGLINVQYSDWTLAIAVQNGMLKGDQPGQLTKLADLALARVLKSAN